jgi:uncharacterized membrane protein YdjX (TVP38/TMEM64 family)
MNQSNDAKKQARVPWVKLLIAFVLIIALSFGFSFLLHSLIHRYDIKIVDYGWLAYLIVFGTSLVSNLTIIAPVPFATGIMIAAATEFNPFLISLFASAGGALGELSGYYAGYLGRKLAISDRIMGYSRLEAWINKYGAWAIFILAVQPVLPFDIGGLIAGAARMPLQKFLPALWAGRFIKYLALVYAGMRIFIYGWWTWVIVGLFMVIVAVILVMTSKKKKPQS